MKNKIKGIVILLISIIFLLVDFFFDFNPGLLSGLTKMYLLFVILPGLILLFSKKENKMIKWGSNMVIASVILSVPPIANVIFLILFGFGIGLIALGVFGVILIILGLLKK